MCRTEPKPSAGIDRASEAEASPRRGDEVVRVCVLKFGSCRARTGTHLKSDYTTIYFRKRHWDRLIGLAGGVERAVTSACRASASRVSAAQVARAGSFTGAVLAEVERSLRLASERAVSIQTRLASDNNSAWS
jgi:hypothetical protein